MARSNYSFKKRQKELARKKKQDQKRQRKLDKDADIPEETSEQPQDEENLRKIEILCQIQAQISCLFYRVNPGY